MWRDQILSPEARRIEEEFRLFRLQELLDTGKWEQDAAGNVVPAGMRQADKDQVTACAVRSIVEQVPVLVGPEGATLVWEATDSLLAGTNTVHSDWPVETVVTFTESEFIDSSINFSR